MAAIIIHPSRSGGTIDDKGNFSITENSNLLSLLYNSSPSLRISHTPIVCVLNSLNLNLAPPHVWIISSLISWPWSLFILSYYLSFDISLFEIFSRQSSLKLMENIYIIKKDDNNSKREKRKQHSGAFPLLDKSSETFLVAQKGRARLCYNNDKANPLITAFYLIFD